MQKEKIRETPKLYPLGSEELVHLFEISDAKIYGVECAVILYNLKFWLRKNLASEKNLNKKDGKTYVWTFNSVKSWSKLFPYLTENQIRRCLEKLEKDGAIITGEFNKTKYDRTKWYTTCEFEVYELADLPNQSGIIDEPIPDINTDINTDNEQFADKSASLISQVIKEMESIDPKNKNYYGNKTQRAACQFLIDNYSYEKVIERIQIIPSLKTSVPYFPSITTPCELRDKWQKAVDSVNRIKLNRSSKVAENLANIIW